MAVVPIEGEQLVEVAEVAAIGPGLVLVQQVR